jgi:hypothetical protein
MSIKSNTTQLELFLLQLSGKGTMILYLNKFPLVRVIFKNWSSFKGKSMVGAGAYTCMKGVMWDGVYIRCYGAYLYDIMWYWPFIWRISKTV